jgi:hypothetical protein
MSASGKATTLLDLGARGLDGAISGNLGCAEMVHLLRRSSTATRICAALVLVLALAAGGAALKESNSAHASSTARASGTGQASATTAAGCPSTVLSTLSSVLQRVYREGVSSERTASAEAMVEGSPALRAAVEVGNAKAARAAAKALTATGHLTNLEVTRNGHTLVSVGGPALAPLHGTLKNAAGAKIADYVLSVWADSGFAAEGSGVAEGLVDLRTAGGHSIAGSAELPDGALAAEGTITRHEADYQYTSFKAQSYPSGKPLSVYLLKPLTAVQGLCGASAEDTAVNTLSSVANLIYEGEAGSRTGVQVARVQHDRALQLAVAQHDASATRAAIISLLNHHIVRLRVSDTKGLLSDVGGPYVLAPVTAPLRANGHRIGSFVLSIQDDEGYLRLTRRLAGLDVLMYMNGKGGQRLVKNSLGPYPGNVPASGDFTYHGHSFRVITVHAKAFPSGPLTIRVLIPIPYS